MMALSALQLSEVNYLIMLDGLYFLAHLYVMASLGQVVRSAWVIRNGDEANGIRQNLSAFLVLTGCWCRVAES